MSTMCPLLVLSMTVAQRACNWQDFCTDTCPQRKCALPTYDCVSNVIRIVRAAMIVKILIICAMICCGHHAMDMDIVAAMHFPCITC